MRSAVLALSQCITAGPEIWKRWQMSSINAHMPVRPLALCRSQFNLVPHRVYYACINSIYTCSKKKIKNILRMHKRTNCLQCWPSTHKDLKMDFHPQLDSLNVTITHTGSYYGIVNIDYDWSLYPIIGTLWDCNPSGVFSPVSVCVCESKALYSSTICNPELFRIWGHILSLQFYRFIFSLIT